jgi:hydrogenase maturation protein HypF
MVFQELPSAVSGPDKSVLACGAWLKNAACVLRGNVARWSVVHGDLGDPDNCVGLQQSVAELVEWAGGSVDAVAHDLHPDFFSTHLAREIGAELNVPVIAVQHHHAHIGVLMAEHGLQEPVIGLALDGVGLGTDGVAWGGELLWVTADEWQRCGHFRQLCLPGGDAAAREPWRMACAALHALGREDEIEARFAPQVGAQASATLKTMLARGLNCPPTTAAGRWFDAAAGALGISVKQAFEAEAAIALEKRAADYLERNGQLDLVGDEVPLKDGVLDLGGLLARLFALADAGDAESISYGAALFHVALADALAQWALLAAAERNASVIALGGGCFLNRVMTERLTARLRQAGLRALLPQNVSCGDAGLALGQAWVARQQI